MKALRLSPIGLAMLLLAAHFFRSERYLLVGICAAMIALLFVRREWSARVLQLALALGTLEWLRTLVVLVATRRAMGQPFVRLTFILGVVALVTALAGLVFHHAGVRRHFRLPPRSGQGGG